MKNVQKHIIFLILFFSFVSSANGSESDRTDYYGFNFQGKTINPKCINLLQPWMSDGATIIKSIIVNTCQNSNQAYEGIGFDVQKDGTITYYADRARSRIRLFK